MSFQRSSIDKSQHQIADDGGGLHVTNLEISSPPHSPNVVPPRYSFLSTRRFSAAPFRRPRPIANSNADDTRQPTAQSAFVSPLSASIASESSPTREVSDSGVNHDDEKEVYSDVEKETVLDRRWFGWTFRRWAFIIGPCVAIVVMAIVLVAVFVTRSNSDGSNSTSSGATSTTTATGSIPTSTSGSLPIPSNSSVNGGVMNGTSLVAAYAGREPGDKIWLYYQNAAGNLAYASLHQNNSWGTPQLVPVTTSVLNGTALTAFNYKDNNIWKTNILYEDASGSLQSILFTGVSKQFASGSVDTNNNISLPTSAGNIKRMSWANITGDYNFLYYTGADGLIHEYTQDIQAKTFSSTHTFPNSNGYSGCAVSYDGINQIMTLHTITTTGQLQMYWRNYTTTNSSKSSPSPPVSSWNTGGTLPSANNKLGFNLDLNSTLSYSQFNDGELFMQEDKTGLIWRVGWTGIGASQQYATPVTTNQTALPGTAFFTQPQIVWMGRSDQAHAFTQQPSGDIAHMVQQDDGSFKIVEYVPT